ncbi:MAG TPA: hypothetical protein VEQ17_03560 [Steroidobacteraceae bacterium]|nr:hypothetical protein [Steroidobacteraceae bacterium]
MRFWHRATRAFAVAALLASGGVAAAADAVPEAAAEAAAPLKTSSRAQPNVELDEVQVISKRLSEMRQDIVKVEDRFFALYNELNTDDDYDVHCESDVPTGTLLAYRTCRTVFYTKAQAAEARYFLNNEEYAPPADLVALERAPEYRDRALAVINSHPELRQLISERDELERQYNQARKKRFKRKWME